MAEKSTGAQSGKAASARAAIKLLKEAAEANINTPERNGALIEPAGEGEIMVTGDLHGNIDAYMLINRIADLFNKPDRRLVLQELVHEENKTGETPCRSHRIVEMAARLKTMFPDRVYLLMGNHEFAEITGLQVAKRGRELNEFFKKGLMSSYGEYWSEVFETLKEFLRTFPLAIRTRKGVFISHSTPSRKWLDGMTLDFLRSLRPGEGLERRSPVYYLLWGRDYSDETADLFAEQVESEVFIVAHTPCDSGFATPSKRHILIDSVGTNGRYLLLPLDSPANQRTIAAGIRRLNSDKAE